MRLSEILIGSVVVVVVDGDLEDDCGDCFVVVVWY